MIDPKRIWSSSQLPTLPSVAVRLLELSRDPEADFKDVIVVLKSDPAITAKILKAANSSFFGFKSPVTSVERAVPLLGTTVVTTLALSFSLVDAAMTTGPLGEHYTAYWKQSIVQAVAAETLAEIDAKTLASDCFLSGLLLDLGRLAMLKTVPKEYLPVLDQWQQRGGALDELERAALGVDHVEIGANLMTHWKLPARLIDTVSLHHAPLSTILSRYGHDEAITERIVSVAAAAGDYFCTIEKGPALDRIKRLMNSFYRSTSAGVDEYLQKTRLRIDRAGDMFAVSFNEMGSSADLMAEANEQLANLAVREHIANAQMEIQVETVEHEKQELETKNQELQQLATRDSLTGLYNRAFFAEALITATHAASRMAQPLAIIFSDIDHFKKLNDTFGHAFGDDVLRGVAQIHADVLRKSDIVARYGGEEFVALVHVPVEKSLERVAERLRQTVEETSFLFEGQAVPVTISIGAAIGVPERDPGNIGTRLMAAADEAMYQSKQEGRNRLVLRSLITAEDRKLAQAVAQKRFSRWLVQRNLLDVATVSKVLVETPPDRMRIGDLAKRLGYLTPAQLEDVRREQESTGARFGRCAVNCGFITEDDLATLLSIQIEPPNLFARALTKMGVLNQAKSDALLREYRDWLAPTATAPAVTD